MTVKKTVIVLEGGKYTVQHNNGSDFKALRYGEPWRSLTGDGLILSLVQYIEELEDRLSVADHEFEGR